MRPNNINLLKSHLKASEHCNVYFTKSQAQEALKYIESLENRIHKNEVELLRALMYAPSSPVSPNKALEIEIWYGKVKQLHQQLNGSE